ncbi:adenosylmethionine--8-amino-7-oxononanoate transaminase [Tsukamurella strandjordii]|uniref:adenosylmethionine--8-amino-7-oxononanoate transaminase n=1 Tax=Tsukamurella TaxID=2060 RepID=UPI001C7D1264|nr:adenosylmethionine--8-amino-7-oxononanoate transaminase [Tsukamurella sp. TY48]GIZ98961.1 adenosylmethionine-8-amino-7-oxononanoate aminotransferase [Tsukamurella sp. TY48]
MTPEEILALDAQTLWHPYSPVGGSGVRVVSSARGVRLTLGDGTEVIDGMSSWWAAIHGYRHPVLDAAAKSQIDSMAHVMFGGLTHASAARLGELLVEITPAGLDTVFLADSGSVSIEVAVKTALQYWRAKGVEGRNRLLTWRGGYHGDTFTPMSVCDPEGGMHALWTDVLASQVFAPAPPAEFDEAYVAELDRLVAEHAHELAAVIVEPVVQGAGGMRFHPPAYVAALREITRRHDVLLILDEIATGFGRTGTLFASDAAGITPDLLCVGKALTGGYVTLAAMLCTDEVARTISESDQGALMHGPTFMGNPLACAIAVASTELLLSRDWRAEVAGIESGLRAGVEPLRELPGVMDVRVLGAIGVVQLDRQVDVARATDACVGAGVWLRPFRDLVYTMPPFISTPDEVAAIAGGVSAAVHAALQ